MALPILRRSGSPVAVRRGDMQGQSTIDRIDPWNDFEMMNRLFDTYFPGPLSLFSRTGRSARGTDMDVELYENRDELIAYLPAPGLARDKFDISATPTSISVRAERTPLLQTTEGLTSHTPMSNWATSSANYSASYDLPVEIDPNKVQADYRDGVLEIRMAKSEAAKPRQVKIELNRQ